MRALRFCASVFKPSLGIFTVLVFSLAVRAQDEAKRLAKTCSACHGERGVSANADWPNLAGQKKNYLIEQLKAFRSGARDNPLMSPVAKTLSDRDIDRLAEYFSQLK
jgi:cytochrome c553